MKPPVGRKCLWRTIPTILLCLISAATAAQSGDFTYTDNGSDITITGYAVEGPLAVVIPATIVDKPVVSIGTGAFTGRMTLTSVTIPFGVTSIESNAFYNCAGLTSVAIPSGVTTIGSGAFFGCAGLTSVTIPSSVTTLGANSFAYCVALTSMTLPSGVTSIGASAFLRCAAMAEVTIPSTVTTIGAQAFQFCSGLTTVVIPSSVTVIQGATFSSCSGLTSVTLPSTITSIGAQAFRYCSGLTGLTIPSSMTTLSDKVFANCRGLTTVAIPAGITSIHVAAFTECSSLTSFTVAATNSSFSTVNGLLMSKDGTTLITCPAGTSGSVTVPSGVTAIGTQAFQLCGELTSVTIPSSVTSIGTQGFYTCGKLVLAVFLGNAPTMGTNVFALAASEFAINFLNRSTGFTSPTWLGYPASGSGESVSPLNSWLLSKGLPANSDLQSDANGDGVNLLMAYALNLDPNANNTFPQPVFTTDQMSLSFYAGTPGVTYTVLASAGMDGWSTQDVTVSAPDANQIRTATVPISGPKRFMRLVVSH